MYANEYIREGALASLRQQNLNLKLSSYEVYEANIS